MANYTGSSATDSLFLLFRLIKTNDWHKLDSMFLVDPKDRRTFQRMAALVAGSKSFKGMTILHLCASFNPPSFIVCKIIDLCPKSPSSRDGSNRTPLHVATGTGASTRVIKVLADAYPEACAVQDKDGRTPLHMACNNESCDLFEESKERGHKETPSQSTISVLLSTSLNSAILEDEDGMSAIEYALLSDADIDTVWLLQRAVRSVMIKKHWEEKSTRTKGQTTSAEGGQATPINRSTIKEVVKRFSPRRNSMVAPSA